MRDGLSNGSVLVTGGAGFIGSEIVRQLLKRDNTVTVLDNLRSGSRSNLDDAVGSVSGTDSVELVERDLRSVDLVDLIESRQIEYVFHLAAKPYVPESYENPTASFSINANGTLRLLLACEEAGVSRILFYSTSEVYGTAREIPMDESHFTYPQSTYAVSKLAADRLCATLQHERDLPVVIVRQFNCYGPRETHPYIVPELISQLSEGPAVTLGNLDASRDLTFVSDAARGAIKLIDTPAAEANVFNLGYGEDITVESLAYRIANLLGYDDVSITVDDHRVRPFDVERLHCDYSKANAVVGYEPQVTLEDGLRRTIEWYEEKGSWQWERPRESLP